MYINICSFINALFLIKNRILDDPEFGFFIHLKT